MQNGPVGLGAYLTRISGLAVYALLCSVRASGAWRTERGAHGAPRLSMLRPRRQQQPATSLGRPSDVRQGRSCVLLAQCNSSHRHTSAVSVSSGHSMLLAEVAHLAQKLLHYVQFTTVSVDNNLCSCGRTESP